jgi:hypothetical protein
MSETYEVHVSAQHWAEGCENKTQGESNLCPVYVAMCEAGVPVSSVGSDHWFELGPKKREHRLPPEVKAAVKTFDFCREPAPLTFTVMLG